MKHRLPNSSIIAVLAVFVLLTGALTAGAVSSAEIGGNRINIKITDTLPQRTMSTGSIADTTTQYGGIGSDYQPVIGDWNGDGTDTLGVYQISTSTFFLSNSVLPGVADLTFNYGIATDMPIAGDWYGMEHDSVGVYRPSTIGGSSIFYLLNMDTQGIFSSEQTPGFAYGIAEDIPVAGDWNGDGIDTIGLYRSSTASYYLRNTNDAGVADVSYNYGWVGADVIPITGDFDGDGVDTGSIYSVTDGGFYIRNSNTDGNADIVEPYGNLDGGDIPLVGDWTGSGKDSIAVYRKAEGTFYLLNAIPEAAPTINTTIAGIGALAVIGIVGYVYKTKKGKSKKT